MSDSAACDILVVGAGPTGLMAANLLARSGVRVRIIERRSEATRESRAFAVQARTLELLQAMGIAQRFIERGVIVHSVKLYVKGRFIGGPDFTMAEADDTPFPYILMIPQSEIEALLIDELRTTGVEVERGVECTGFAETVQGISARLSHSDGTTGAIEARYIFGGDGSRSIVRQGAGLKWKGELLPQRFLLADCRVEWPFDHDNFRVFMNGPLIGLFLPLNGEKCSRVMATDTSGGFGDEDGSKPAPLDLDEMQRGLAAALNLPVRLSDPVWVTRYRAHHRFVDRYNSGRTFVGGDAAHIHSPAGGQGMNTGLQDAANLAWKLAAVCHGAPPALLNSYDEERRPVGEAVVKTTGKLFAAAAGQAGMKARLRDFFLPILMPFISGRRSFQKRAFRNISQRGIVYSPDGRLIEPDRLTPGGPVAGARAPDAATPDGDTLFERFSGYRFTLLALSVDRETEAKRTELATLHTSIRRIGPRAQLVAIDQIASDSNLAHRYGLSSTRRSMLYVVRPDGYVGWRGKGLDAHACANWLQGWSGTHD